MFKVAAKSNCFFSVEENLYARVARVTMNVLKLANRPYARLFMRVSEKDRRIHVLAATRRNDDVFVLMLTLRRVAIHNDHEVVVYGEHPLASTHIDANSTV